MTAAAVHGTSAHHACVVCAGRVVEQDELFGRGGGALVGRVDLTVDLFDDVLDARRYDVARGAACLARLTLMLDLYGAWALVQLFQSFLFLKEKFQINLLVGRFLGQIYVE